MKGEPMEKTRAVIFDFDGTIVDSMDSFADTAAAVMPRHFPIEASEARRLYLETSGLPFFQQLDVLFPDNPANKIAAAEFERLKLEGYFAKPLCEGVAETIDHMRQRGIKVAVSSNNFQELVDRFVARINIPFDMVMGFRENFAKGADHFSHAERALELDRDRMTFVGDSIKDGERAQEFGIGFIAKEGIFTREQFSERFPDAAVISKLSELREIFS